MSLSESLIINEHKKAVMAAYKQGFIEGIKTYSYMNNGTYCVGTTGRTLEEAIAMVEDSWNYTPSEVKF